MFISLLLFIIPANFDYADHDSQQTGTVAEGIRNQQSEGIQGEVFWFRFTREIPNIQQDFRLYLLPGNSCVLQAGQGMYPVKVLCFLSVS